MSFASLPNNDFLIIDFDEGENSSVNHTELNPFKFYGGKKKDCQMAEL